jgi:hypothetical protein
LYAGTQEQRPERTNHHPGSKVLLESSNRFIGVLYRTWAISLHRAAIAANQSGNPVYLAMPDQAYTRLMKDSAVNIIIKQCSIKLVVVDIMSEEVVQWLH